MQLIPNQWGVHLAVGSLKSFLKLRAEKFLTPRELSELAGISHKFRCEQSLAGRLLLKQILQSEMGIAPLSAETKKLKSGAISLRVLEAASAKYFVSLSHSRNFVAAAVGKYRLGIDIEEGRVFKSEAQLRRRIGLTGKWEAELSTLELWVLKEAVSKAAGGALLSNVRLVSPSRARLRSRPFKCKHWEVRRGVYLGLAVQKP